jgi:hypothetical protein
MDFSANEKWNTFSHKNKSSVAGLEVVNFLKCGALKLANQWTATKDSCLCRDLLKKMQSSKDAVFMQDPIYFDEKKKKKYMERISNTSERSNCRSRSNDGSMGININI